MPFTDARNPWFCISIADDAGEVRAGRNADAFLLLRQAHELHLGVLLGHADQVDEPGLGQRRHEADADVLEAVVDELGAQNGNWHTLHRLNGSEHARQQPPHANAANRHGNAEPDPVEQPHRNRLLAAPRRARGAPQSG